jgi:hypothetical protein
MRRLLALLYDVLAFGEIVLRRIGGKGPLAAFLGKEWSNAM